MFKAQYTTSEDIKRRHGFSLRYSPVMTVWSLDYEVEGEQLSITIDPAMMRRIAANLIWALKAKRQSVLVAYADEQFDWDSEDALKAPKGMLVWTVSSELAGDRMLCGLTVVETGQPAFVCVDRDALRDVVSVVLTDSDANLLAGYEYQVRIVVEEPSTSW
jgi:hypothetical protein